MVLIVFLRNEHGNTTKRRREEMHSALVKSTFQVSHFSSIVDCVQILYSVIYLVFFYINRLAPNFKPFKKTDVSARCMLLNLQFCIPLAH